MKQVDNIFQLFEKGDQQISRSHPQAIFLVGPEKVGKSTTFNWANGFPLVGQGKFNTSYILTAQEDSIKAAKISKKFGPVTLVPNIFVDFSHDTSMIDMPSSGATRNQVQTIGVSYFIKALFERVRKAKFVIVISESRFLDETGDGMIKTFTGFFNMFRMDLLTPEMRSKLIQSVGLLITKSKEGENHDQYLELLIQNLESAFDANLITQQIKNLMIEFLKKILEEKRMSYFTNANHNGKPQKCNFLNKWNQQSNWKFFDFDDIQGDASQFLASVPFEENIDRRGKDEKEKFQQTVNKRVKQTLELSSILQVFFDTFRQNWIAFSEKWKNQQKIEPQFFNMKPVFDKIRQFIGQIPVHHKNNLVIIDKKLAQIPQSMIKYIEKSLDIYSMVLEIVNSERDNMPFEVCMKQVSTKFSAIIEDFQVFARSKEEEEMIKLFNLLTQRLFKYFLKLFEFQPNPVQNIKYSLPEKLSVVIENSKQIYMEIFVNQQNQDILFKIIPTLSSLAKKDLPCQYFQEVFSPKQLSSFQREIQRRTKLTKGDHQEVEIEQSNEDSKAPEEERQIILDSIFRNKISVIRKIVNILKKFPGLDNNVDKKAALKICQKHNLIDDACELFQLILNSPDISSAYQKEIFEKYTSYLIEWGFLEEAKVILIKKLRFAELTMNEQKETANIMKEILNNYQSLSQKAMVKYQELRRVPNDCEFGQHLGKVKISK